MKAARRVRLTDFELRRLLERIEITDTCWLWRGWLNPDGYGVVWVERRSQLAHRIMYRHVFGRIPAGYDIDHVKARGCVNRHCLRPTHLEAVPHFVNVRRDDVGRVYRALTHCPYGHPYSGDNLVLDRSPRRVARACRVCKIETGRRRRARLRGEDVPLRRVGARKGVKAA